jgi:hypothetical protein
MPMILLETTQSCTLESLWAKLYHFGDASSSLSLTGLSHQAFTQLYDTLFLDEQPQRTGSPQLIHPTAQLVLYLF